VIGFVGTTFIERFLDGPKQDEYKKDHLVSLERGYLMGRSKSLAQTIGRL